MLYNNEGDTVPFTAESGYILEFFYTKDYYPDYKDTYIIQSLLGTYSQLIFNCL